MSRVGRHQVCTVSWHEATRGRLKPEGCRDDGASDGTAQVLVSVERSTPHRHSVVRLMLIKGLHCQVPTWHEEA